MHHAAQPNATTTSQSFQAGMLRLAKQPTQPNVSPGFGQAFMRSLSPSVPHASSHAQHHHMATSSSSSYVVVVVVVVVVVGTCHYSAARQHDDDGSDDG
jgi:hypothetical protein